MLMELVSCCSCNVQRFDTPSLEERGDRYNPGTGRKLRKTLGVSVADWDKAALGTAHTLQQSLNFPINFSGVTPTDW